MEHREPGCLRLPYLDSTGIELSQGLNSFVDDQRDTTNGQAGLETTRGESHLRI